jgi:hypothetical protein
MGTEKFIAFKEDGSAYRLKGRILRFLDNEPVSEADKTNIRSTLSVPASAEGLTPANNLSDLDSAATARTNLSVNSIDEDAQANGTKVTAPSMYFNGSSYVEVADDDKLSFTDGADDLPFSVSAWVKMGDATSFPIVAKFPTTVAQREWTFGTTGSDYFELNLLDTAGGFESARTTSTVTSYEGQWTHVCATFEGAGPNSSNSFANASSGISLYINGVSQAVTSDDSGTYVGMSNTVGPVYIGRAANSYAKGSIRDCKIFNRELTSTEIAQLARGNDLGFADEWGGANGGAYASDFSAGVDGWVALSNVTLTGNVDSIGGGVNDNLRLIPNTTNGLHSMYKNALTEGKRFRVSFDYYIPGAANSNIDGFRVVLGSAGDVSNVVSATTDLWTSHEFEGVCDTGSGLLLIYATDGGNTTFQDAGGDDTMYIRNVKVTEIGTLADFRSERYDTSTNKLYDISDNAFVGTGTSVSLTGREVPVYETGTWTPSITFGGGSTGIGYSAQEGVYTRIGNTCFVAGVVTLSSVGSDTGTARLAGLPFLNHNMTATSYGSSSVVAFDMTGLTSVVNLLNEDNQPNAILYDSGATGGTAVTNGNFTSTSSLRFSMTYQIQ